MEHGLKTCLFHAPYKIILFRTLFTCVIFPLFYPAKKLVDNGVIALYVGFIAQTLATEHILYSIMDLKVAKGMVGTVSVIVLFFFSFSRFNLHRVDVIVAIKDHSPSIKLTKYRDPIVERAKEV